MFNLQVTSTTMELLPLVCLCLLTRSGTTFAEEGPKVIEVEEGSDVTLPCSLSSMENIEFKLFDWKKDGQKEVFLYDAGIHSNNGRAGQDEQFKGRVSHFQDELEFGNASIIIRNTKVTDSGDYTCVFPRLRPSQIFHIRLAVGSKVINVEEDSDVTLPCSLSSKEDISKMVFDWKKDGQKEVFLYDAGDHYNNGRTGQDQQFKGRVSHFQDKLEFGDASIKINNTRVADSGDYTCAFPRLQPRQIFHIRLVVVGRLNGGPGPKVIRVKEGSVVTLPCSLSTKENIEYKLFDWKKDGQKEVFLYDAGLHYNNGRAGQDQQFKGRVSHFPDKLKHGDASIIIRNMSVTDSGDYTCAFPLQPNETFHIRLVVGAAPKPHIMKFETKDGALLLCVVLDASPKPKVEWQDSAGKRLPAEEPQVPERGGRYDIILNTTVTKTDRYRCVVTQEEIDHRTDATIDVDIRGPILKDGESGFPTESPTGLVVAVSVIAAVLCTLLVVGGVLYFLYKKGYFKLNIKKGSSQETSIPLNGGSQT